MSEPLLVTISQAGARLNVGRSKVFALLAAKQLLRVKVGRRTLIPANDCDELARTWIAAARSRDSDPGTSQGS
jgi:excisionase family DNA binding protein